MQTGQVREGDILLVAGEASGDIHGASLVDALRATAAGRPWHVFGMGGSALRKAGMETVVDSETSASVMGLAELVSHIPQVVTAFRTIVREAERRRPAVAVLIDFPDFNLRLAKRLHKMGVKVLYFISPQLWAWRRYRVHTMRRYVRKVAPIFPFEEEYFRAHGVDATYVGHPFMDRPQPSFDRAEFLHGLGLEPEKPVIALLPGSRWSEVTRLFPPLLEAFVRLRKSRPGAQAVVPVAPTLPLSWFAQRVGETPGVALVSGHADRAVRSSDVAVVASGTATVEAALQGVPFVVVYKLSPSTHRIAKLLVRGVDHFAMVNVIAGREVVPELLQDEVTAERVAMELEGILGDPAKRTAIVHGLSEVQAKLALGSTAGSTAALRTAGLVWELMDEAVTVAPGADVVPKEPSRAQAGSAAK